MKKNNKRLFFDIETSPNIGLFWESGYKKNIPYDNIIQERAIICICYKWEGDKTVHSLTWDKNHNDKSMLEKFIKIANSADELVAQNGDKFDLPWIRTRCLYHNIPMFPTYSTVDTLKKAKYYFRFNSNTLNYMSQFLKIGSKIHTEFDLWKRIVLHKEDKALNYMVKYCQEDVRLLEKVFNKLKNYIGSNVHHGAEVSKCSCPECSSMNFSLSKVRYTSVGHKRFQLQCSDCGKYYTVSESLYKKYS